MAWLKLVPAWAWWVLALLIVGAGQFEVITKRINGGLTGQAERVALWEAAKRVLL